MKIVAVTSRFPHPMERGDKRRAQHQLRELAKRHDVALIALSEGPVAAADRTVLTEAGVRTHVVERSRATTVASVARGAARGVPIQVGYFRSPSSENRVRRLIEAESPDRLYCQLIRTAWAAEGSEVPTVIDFQDALAAAMKRRAEGQPPGIRHAFEFESRRIARAETEAFELFDRRLVISEQDRSTLEVPDRDAVEVLSNGVDTDFFAPGGPTPSDPVDIAFVGNMGYPPNVRAARYLAKEVLPLVRSQRPGARLLLAGARPSRGVRALAASDVLVSGWMDDIRDAYRRGRVMVAPLFIGSGQQNKILEAMAMGVPVVTTELVNNSIGAKVGTELLVASDPAGFASAALELLESPQRAEEIAEAGASMVASRFGWTAVGERLSGIIEGT